MRSRSATGVQTFTADDVIDRFGVVKGSYDTVPLPKIKAYTVRGTALAVMQYLHAPLRSALCSTMQAGAVQGVGVTTDGRTVCPERLQQRAGVAGLYGSLQKPAAAAHRPHTGGCRCAARGPGRPPRCSQWARSRSLRSWSGGRCSSPCVQRPSPRQTSTPCRQVRWEGSG